jgi:hypothetical protein
MQPKPLTAETAEGAEDAGRAKAGIRFSRQKIVAKREDNRKRPQLPLLPLHFKVLFFGFYFSEDADQCVARRFAVGFAAGMTAGPNSPCSAMNRKGSDL